MKKMLIAIVVLVLLSSVLAGCTNQDNDNIPPAGTTRPVSPNPTVSPMVSPAVTALPTMTASPMASPNVTGDNAPMSTVSPAGSPVANQ